MDDDQYLDGINSFNYWYDKLVEKKQGVLYGWPKYQGDAS